MASPLDAYIESLAAGGAPAAAPVAPVAARAPGMLSRVASGAKGLGAKLIRGGLAVAPVAGAAGAALDSPENVSRMAASSGLDYNTFGGRVGANVLNFLSKTGDVASLGLASTAGEKISRLISGQPFFEPYAQAAPVVTAPAAPAGPMGPVPGTMEGYDSLMAAPRAPVTIDNATGAVVPPPAPFTAADVAGSRVPASGFGAFRRTTPGNEGEVVNVGSPAAAGFGAAPGRYVPRTFAGSAVQAGGDLALMGNQARQTSATNKLMAEQKLAYDKMAAEQSTAQNTALMNYLARTQAASSPQFTVPLNAMPDPRTGAFPMAQTRGAGAGTARMVTPQRSATAANIQAWMRDNPGKTREQAVAAHKAAGIDVSGL